MPISTTSPKIGSTSASTDSGLRAIDSPMNIIEEPAEAEAPREERVRGARVGEHSRRVGDAVLEEVNLPARLRHVGDEGVAVLLGDEGDLVRVDDAEDDAHVADARLRRDVPLVLLVEARLAVRHVDRRVLHLDARDAAGEVGRERIVLGRADARHLVRAQRKAPKRTSAARCVRDGNSSSPGLSWPASLNPDESIALPLQTFA